MEDLRDHVFAPDLFIDYGNFTNSPGKDISREDWLGQLEKFMDSFKGTQHVVT